MRRTVAVGLVALVLTVACGDDGTGGGTADPSGSTHPPTSVEELAAVFDPMLEALGLRITRGGLFDRSDGDYTASAEGGHLALYVEPIDDRGYDTDDYVEGIGTVTALVTPAVFERWSGVDTYDICQEPPADVDAGDEPAPYTQFEIDRATSETVDWDAANAETVIELAAADRARLFVTPVIQADPRYRAATGEPG